MIYSFILLVTLLVLGINAARKDVEDTCHVIDSCVNTLYRISRNDDRMMCMDFDYMLKGSKYGGSKYGEYWQIQIENLNNCTTTIAKHIDFKSNHKRYSKAKSHLDKFEIGKSYQCWRHETECEASWVFSTGCSLSIDWLILIGILAVWLV